MQDRNLITITVPVIEKPDCFDWLGRKVIVTPVSVTLYFAPGDPTPVEADVTGPCRRADPRMLPISGTGTIAYYAIYPSHWPDWLRDLARQYQPPAQP
ncbi:hypothetical protein [Streptomyces sp. NPDC005953]|uniref:hypothetical protein n=1 Tax=Streptomyces sp. NPDC005953 TaxID=3156719 RepID=UPI0033C57393